MSTKLTKRDYFNMLLAVEEVKENEALVAFINHEVELLDKKNGSDKKPTKEQEANENLKVDLVVALGEAGKALQVKEIQKLPGMENYTNQKISALLRQLVEAGTVVRTEEKKVAYFAVA